MNLASCLKQVSKNLVAKAQAPVEREKKKDILAENQSQAIVDATQIKHQPVLIQQKAMGLV